MILSRPLGSASSGHRFCLVVERTAGRVTTACGGSWSATEAEESTEAPTQEERCGRCWGVTRAKERAVVELERFERNLEQEG